jgi:hypothetical protein
MANIYFQVLDKALCTDDIKPSPALNAPQPSWWKDMPRYYGGNADIQNQNFRNFATVRNCPAVNDAVNFGYTIYLPYDLYIDASDESQIRWYAQSIDGFVNENLKDYISLSDKNSMGNFYIPEKYHSVLIRINPLWGVKTDPGYSIFVTQPVNRLDLPLLTFAGVIDSDVFPARESYTFAIKKGFNGTIKSGTPLLQVIPFKREDFVSVVTDSDTDLYSDTIRKLTSVFTNGYKKFFWHRKKFN